MFKADAKSTASTQSSKSFSWLPSAVSGLLSSRPPTKESIGDDTGSASSRSKNSDATAASSRLRSALRTKTATDPFLDLLDKLWSQLGGATRLKAPTFGEEIREIYQEYRVFSGKFPRTVRTASQCGLASVTAVIVGRENLSPFLSVYFAFEKEQGEEEGEVQPIRENKSVTISKGVEKVAKQGKTSETAKYGWNEAVYQNIKGAEKSSEMLSDGYCWVTWKEKEDDTETFHFYGLIDTSRYDKD